ncbi:uncharacterized protein LOC131850289 [Achroia grisella]|uniref:uncharacterized protein LOC131850289 n=1 Tax=Achroia grisella TaxID=688607 RepID=UPI0027D29814|nr:uncharacterized protein LOC131850289 [Achroia grisella]
MSAEDTSKKLYLECGDLKRIEPEYTIDEAILKEIGSNYRTIPTFEKSVYEQVYIRHYSLKSNKFLACRWEQYKQQMESRTFTPFQFPDNRDLHFHNDTIRYLPSESLHRTLKFKMKMNCGPGVDSYGQIPIPQELLMKRSQIEQDKEHKHNKNKKKQCRKVFT